MNTNSPLLLFDGVCNLCNRMVQFILKHEKDRTIHFSTLQSAAVRDQMESILFIEDNVVYKKSKAVYKICNHLKAPWSWFRIFDVFPTVINDFFYDIIAKYRYRIFGKSDHCMIPDKDLEHRFI